MAESKSRTEIHELQKANAAAAKENDALRLEIQAQAAALRVAQRVGGGTESALGRGRHDLLQAQQGEARAKRRVLELEDQVVKAGARGDRLLQELQSLKYLGPNGDGRGQAGPAAAARRHGRQQRGGAGNKGLARTRSVGGDLRAAAPARLVPLGASGMMPSPNTLAGVALAERFRATPQSVASHSHGHGHPGHGHGAAPSVSQRMGHYDDFGVIDAYRGSALR